MPRHAGRIAPVATAALLAAAAVHPAPGDERRIDPAACAVYANSVQQVPDWYADACLGGNAVTDYSAYAAAPGLVPGDIAYYKRNFPAPLDVKVAPLQTLAFTTIGPNAQPLFAMAFNPPHTALYAVDNTSRQFGTINQATGAFTAIGTLSPDPGAAFTVLGLAFDATTNQAYLSLSNTVTGMLFRIDVGTAALTLVGPLGSPLAIDLAVDSSGQMWSMDIVADTLLRVDKNTGATTVVGPTGMHANFAQGMMYDHSDNTLYGCAFVTVPALQGQLVRFDTATGAATVLAGPVPDEMECSIKRCACPCPGPAFAGLVSAASAGAPNCAVNLTWNAAAPCPGTAVKYNVYRSTTAGTPPSGATLLASCIPGLGYTDTTALSGTRYYYRVRAEDNTTGGSGPCNGGAMDNNQVERSVVAGGPSTTVTDDVEGGGAAWDTTGGTGANAWAIVSTASHSPVSSWFWPDPASVSLQPLTRVASFTFGPGGGRLAWWHRVLTQSTFDGYVLEYSLDGGTTWTDILLGQGAVPANPDRFLQNGYNTTLSTGGGNPLPGRRAWSGTLGDPGFAQVVVDMDDFAGLAVKIRWRAGSDASGPATGIWIDDIALSATASCTSVSPLFVAPLALAVDATGNSVYEPNETVVVAPTWRNAGQQAIAPLGALSSHTGPAGPGYSIPDAAAVYGTIAVNGSGSCTATGNCYSVANTAAARPATHWDSTAVETITPGTQAAKTWTLHVGGSFADVPSSNPFYRFVEILLHRGVTAGCTPTLCCPSSSTTREQMAVFVLLSKEAPGYVPTGCVAGSEAFGDVPAASPFCRWIEELARRGIVSGCGGGNYCPLSAVTREQMAVFVLRTLDPALNPPACVPPNLYLDVPETSGFCRWIEELTTRGVVSGCGGGNYCPAAPVTREQMGVFLSVTFGLTLYGV